MKDCGNVPNPRGKDLGHSRNMKEFLMDFCFDSLEDAVKEQLDSMSKKSPTGPTERTPKPEYLIALATSLGVRW